MPSLYLYGLIALGAIMLAVAWRVLRAIARRRDEWQEAIDALSESRLMIDHLDDDRYGSDRERRQPVRPTRVPGVSRLPGREASTTRRAA